MSQARTSVTPCANGALSVGACEVLPKPQRAVVVVRVNWKKVVDNEYGVAVVEVSTDICETLPTRRQDLYNMVKIEENKRLLIAYLGDSR